MSASLPVECSARAIGGDTQKTSVEHGAEALDDVVGHDRLDVLLQVLFRI